MSKTNLKFKIQNSKLADINLLQEFDQTITNNLGAKPKSLLLAISGGVDSMVLAAVAKCWAEENNVKIMAVTVDHGLREDSAREASQVHEEMISLGIEHEILKWQRAEDVTSNIEAKAREARYDLLKDYAMQKKIAVIVTAHHLDDQVETFFMRLSRGSGIDGLAAMQNLVQLDGDLDLFRPFLSLNKTLLQEYAKAEQLKWFEDETNQDTKFLRNNLRNLLSQVEDKELIDKRVVQTTKHFARARDFLIKETDNIYNKLVNIKADALEIELAEFKKLHEEIALRLLVRIFQEIGGKAYKPRFEKLEALYQKLLTDQIQKSTTFAHCLISINKSRLIFRAEKL